MIKSIGWRYGDRHLGGKGTVPGYVRSPELSKETGDTLTTPLLPGLHIPLTAIFEQHFSSASMASIASVASIASIAWLERARYPDTPLPRASPYASRLATHDILTALC